MRYDNPTTLLPLAGEEILQATTVHPDMDGPVTALRILTRNGRTLEVKIAGCEAAWLELRVAVPAWDDEAANA